MDAAKPEEHQLQDQPVDTTHLKPERTVAEQIHQQHADLYYEALERFGQDGDIDKAAEKKLVR